MLLDGSRGWPGRARVVRFPDTLPITFQSPCQPEAEIRISTKPCSTEVLRQTLQVKPEAGRSRGWDSRRAAGRQASGSLRLRCRPAARSRGGRCRSQARGERSESRIGSKLALRG
jgi:hypothetical protein